MKKILTCLLIIGIVIFLFNIKLLVRIYKLNKYKADILLFLTKYFNKYETKNL